MNELPLLYRQLATDDSLMAGDSLIFATSAMPVGETWGMSAHSMPDTPHRSDVVAVSLLLCFFLLFVVRVCYRGKMKDSFSAFFLPSNSGDKAVDNNGVEWKRIIVALLFSLQGAIFILVTTEASHLVSPVMSPWILVGVFALLLLLYIIAKQFLYHFVHSVFFTKAQQHRWRENYTFLFTALTLLLFLLLLLLVYLHLDLKIVLISGLSVLLFVKILLLFKCFSTFFEKIDGILHLFVYFCTLEAAPLVVLWTILKDFTQGFYLL